MEKLEKLLPGFAAEMKDALTELARADLAEMIPVLTLNQVTYYAEADALYLCIRGTRELNVVEKNIIGVKHGESIELKACPGIVVLDTDNFGRISCIEILGRKDVYDKLKEDNAL